MRRTKPDDDDPAYNLHGHGAPMHLPSFDPTPRCNLPQFDLDGLKAQIRESFGNGYIIFDRGAAQATVLYIETLQRRVNAMLSKIKSERDDAAMNPEIEHIAPIYRILDAISDAGGIK